MRHLIDAVKARLMLTLRLRSRLKLKLQLSQRLLRLPPPIRTMR